MKNIPLSQGKFALVDDEDFEYLNQWKWYAGKSRNTFYSQRHTTVNGKVITIKMHRLLLKANQIDHKDGNGLNNQKSNLRACTQSQNNWNMKSRGGSSKYKGVCWAKHANKWLARIRYYGKLKHLGYFDCQIEAAQAYDNAAIAKFGEFAKPNFN